jgi:hypothetical protein
MEVTITINDGGVTTEKTLAASHPGATAPAVPGFADSIADRVAAATASGAINAGPAPSGLSGSGFNGPLPFVTGAQEFPGAPAQTGAGRASDQSAGAAPSL